MDKILVTGAAGLIGSAVCERLSRQGYEVVRCDIRFKDNPLSFTETNAIKLLLSECVGVIHLAAISRVIHGEIYPELCYKVNVEDTIKFVELCKSSENNPWLIYGSSREVYGNQSKLPVIESDTWMPVNHYARGKVLIEQLITELASIDFNVSILRFSNVYGGLLDHADRVIPAFCINALEGKDLVVEGKECIFDFTYVEDVVEGIALAVDYLHNFKTSLPPIHFTACSPCNLENLANIILDTTQSSSKIDFRAPRNFDVNSFYGDFSRAKKLLGWSPRYSLSDGLAKFISDIEKASKVVPQNIDMVIYEDIKSYTWLPALL